MPSQRPVIIPPSATLDPEFCARWGRPLFAWHPYSGRIATSGGGLAISRGAVLGVRGAAGTGATTSGGAIKVDGTANAYLNYGHAQSKAFRFVSPNAFTIWTRMSTTSSLRQYVFGIDSVSGGINEGWALLYQNNGFIQFVSGNGTSHNPTNGPAYAGNGTVNNVMVAVSDFLGTTPWEMYSDGIAQSLTFGTAVNATYSFTPDMALGARTDAFGAFTAAMTGALYGAAVWRGRKPQRLAEILTATPDAMWWWPGKSRRTYSFVSAGSALSLNLTETLTFTDTLSKSLTKVLSEILSFTDSRTVLAAKVLLETLSFTDTVSKTAVKALSEVLTFLDTRSVSFLKSLGETLNFTDTVSPALVGLAVLLHVLVSGGDDGSSFAGRVEQLFGGRTGEAFGGGAD